MKHMSDESFNLDERLEFLNSLVDSEHVQESERMQLDALSYLEVPRLPTLDSSPVKGWQGFPYSEAFHDPVKMMINELGAVYAGATLRDDRAYTIRANYGVGTVASMFGCEISLTMNNMPWCEPLTEDALLAALDAGIPEMTSGLGAKVLETERLYLETLANYPNLREAVHVYVCDTQGPFDIAHLVMGHRIYTDLYDNPDLVHRMLNLATETYIAFTKAQKAIIGEGNTDSYHTHARVHGGIRICEDSPTNISPAAYLEFCRPYNEWILAEFDGGWIHYCGGGHHIFPHIISTAGLKGVNFGNPELQDLGAIYEAASERGIGIINWKSGQCPEDERAYKTGITRIGRPL